MTVSRDTLFDWIDTTLNAHAFKDYSPVGMQVEGRSRVRKIALGVSAHLELIEQATAWGADALLVHHGFFWRGEPQILKGWRKARIKALLLSDMSLGSYHLPLDAHLEVGNNAQLADLLGCDPEGRSLFAKAGGQPIGLICRDLPRPAADVIARINELFDTEPLVFDYGPELIDIIAIVTGGGAPYFEEARELGAQLFLTGEPREPTMAEAKETQTHFVAAGHYNTETVGIKALGERIADKFDVETRFFSIPNPV